MLSRNEEKILEQAQLVLKATEKLRKEAMELEITAKGLFREIQMIPGLREWSWEHPELARLLWQLKEQATLNFVSVSRITPAQ